MCISEQEIFGDLQLAVSFGSCTSLLELALAAVIAFVIGNVCWYSRAISHSLKQENSAVQTKFAAKQNPQILYWCVVAKQNLRVTRHRSAVIFLVYFVCLLDRGWKIWITGSATPRKKQMKTAENSIITQVIKHYNDYANASVIIDKKRTFELHILCMVWWEMAKNSDIMW